jgi:hypothetical protein
MSELCTAILTDEGIVVRVPYFLRSVLEGVRGRRWDAMERAWILPATDENVRILSGINGLRFDDALAAMISAAEGEAESADAAYPDTAPISHMRCRESSRTGTNQGFNLGVSIPAWRSCTSRASGKSHRDRHHGAPRKSRWRAPRSRCRAGLRRSGMGQRNHRLLDIVDFRVTALEGSSKDKAAQVRALKNRQARDRRRQLRRRMARSARRRVQGVETAMIIADESQRIKNPSAAQSKIHARSSEDMPGTNSF